MCCYQDYNLHFVFLEGLVMVNENLEIKFHVFDVVFIYSRKSSHPCHCAYVYHYQLLFISNSQPTLL
jgi:hypothetical protein